MLFVKDLNIRMATEPDAENIHSVLHEAFREFRHLYTTEAMAATVIGPAEVCRRIGEGPLWVAETEGKTVGTISVLARDEGAYVRGMAVLPAVQGLKIGLRLLQTAEQFAQENGFYRLFLRTTPYLGNAIRLYERFGFASMPGTEAPFFATPSFLMEKYLSAEA